MRRTRIERSHAHQYDRSAVAHPQTSSGTNSAKGIKSSMPRFLGSNGDAAMIYSMRLSAPEHYKSLDL